MIGLFGCADLVDTEGENAGNRFTTLQGGGHKKVLAFKQAMLDEGIISLFRNWCVRLLFASTHCSLTIGSVHFMVLSVHCSMLHVAPPLVITEAELRDGFQRMHRALKVLA